MSAITQRQHGWWVCDGTIVKDPRAGTWNGKATPNLLNRFLMASDTSGITGGAGSYDIKAIDVESHTYSFGKPDINMDPRVNVCGAQTWCTGASHLSKGTVAGQNVPTTPPYYSVIYLIKVK
jgi:hypothetical protein